MTSIVQCLLRSVEPKQSKKGNTYYRCECVTSEGTKWETCFDGAIMSLSGQTVELAFRPMGEGLVIDTFMAIDNPVGVPTGPSHAAAAGQAPMPTPTPAGPPPVGMPGHKDLFILTECIYQHDPRLVHDAETGHAEQAARVAIEAAQTALIINQAFAQLPKDGIAGAFKYLQSMLPGEPGQKVSEIAARARVSEAQHEPTPHPGPHAEQDHGHEGGFSDDIPF